MNVRCPSGLTVEVRKLKGREGNVLADRRSARRGETFDKLLTNCTLRVTDPGIYNVAEGGTLPWGKVLICDRFVALVAIRIATYGTDYIFKAHCDESDSGCGKRFEWEINLETEMPLFDLPEESRIAVKDGRNRFETTAGGRKVVFKLQRGEDEHKAAKRLADAGATQMTTALATRIVEVDGVEPRQIEKWLEDLDITEQLELLDRFDEVDGGFDTEVEIECPGCDRVFKVNPPFGGADYWLPRRPSRKKSRDGRKFRTLAASGSETKTTTG